MERDDKVWVEAAPAHGAGFFRCGVYFQPPGVAALLSPGDAARVLSEPLLRARKLDGPPGGWDGVASTVLLADQRERDVDKLRRLEAELEAKNRKLEELAEKARLEEQELRDLEAVEAELEAKSLDSDPDGKRGAKRKG